MMIMTQRRQRRAQSAMEYLMTYGWAILIIAVVLGALFQLGVFNANNFAPKAPPGACYVVRIGGTVSLEGECQGELPEFVANFNGANSQVSITRYPTISQSAFTITGWVLLTQFNSSNGLQGWWANSTWHSTVGLQSYPNAYPGASSGGFTLFFHNATSGAGPGTGSFTASFRKWYFVAETGNGITMNMYVNGASAGTANYFGPFGNMNHIVIGAYYAGASGAGNVMNGSEANIQVYNTTLSQAEINASYAEGIGGAPVKPQNLVGWWPLNGNANDYSGNNDDGTATDITYSGSWASQYSGPQ